jgi:acyl transferase domain-containing protein
MSGQQIAAFFPGQGVLDTDVFSRYRNAGAEVIAMFAEVDAVARAVCRTPLPRAPWRRGHPGAGLDLSIFLASVVSYRKLQRAGLHPRAVVGHGFGEIAALVAADALSLRDGAEVVARRFIALAARTTRSRMALLKISPAHVGTFLRLLNHTVSVAAENSATDRVIVGSTAGIAAAEDLARMLGLPFRRLKTMCGPHNQSLRGIEQELVGSLAHVARRTPVTPVYSPLRGRFYRADDDVVAGVAEQLSQPVRFAAAVKDLVATGVTLFVECGPLRGMAAGLDCRAIPDFHVHNRASHDASAAAAASQQASELSELEVA